MEKGERRTPAQIEWDRTVAFGLRLRGKTQTEIAAELGVSQQAVSRDLAAVQRDYERRHQEERDHLRAAELARLDVAEAAAWREWDRSREDAVETTSKLVQAGANAAGEGGTPRVETGETRKGRLGDPRYLEIVIRCDERRSKLLGLDAPTEIDLGRSWAEIAAAAVAELNEEAKGK